MNLARLALNFKGLKYKTQWVEYPDIAPLLGSLNVTPNANPRAPPYTLPAARFPNGETLQDSLIIAAKLEELFPAPSMRFDDPIIPNIQKAVMRAFLPLFAIVSPSNNRILNESSYTYFLVKDAKDVAEYGPDPEGETAWEAATEPLENLAKLVQGPFVLGSEVSYADFVIGGFLRHTWRVAGAEVLERVLRMDESGKLRGVYEGLEEKGLLERSD
ncbi:hypothetical protein BP6252_10998 [Coleophoma cylindrospora]|uniref:Uncharacterized protein n=1 Tax=Coleophoma cylindrospora TaxID=1849047 RepID=A0A3D8QNQ0_9HELO|nr:hypothetical protein BP6252_10998 [Coleophoma cylindrospora]